jgi:cytochrome d ubiquinol oxidase subunit II
VTLADVAAGAILAALNGYLLFGGADFGGGVWDLLASGPRRERQRELVAHAIGPVWEANHVWLIIAIVVLFTAFPPAFARMAIVLHIPLTLMLAGVVLRGSAFVFRSYGVQEDAVNRRWGGIFASASLVTPVLLGVVVGTVAAGKVPLGGERASDFVTGYVTPWCTGFALAVGLFTLACCAFLAAVYLTVEAVDPRMRDDFRRRAIGAGVAVFLTAAASLLVGRGGAPRVSEALLSAPWALELHLMTGTAAVTAFGALLTRRYRVARVAAALQVSLILWGWALAQYPYLLPPSLTIDAAAAPAATLRLLVGTLAAGALLLFPSLGYLFWIFKGRDAPSATAQ